MNRFFIPFLGPPSGPLFDLILFVEDLYITILKINSGASQEISRQSSSEMKQYGNSMTLSVDCSFCISKYCEKRNKPFAWTVRFCEDIPSTESLCFQSFRMVHPYKLWFYREYTVSFKSKP